MTEWGRPRTKCHHLCGQVVLTEQGRGVNLVVCYRGVRLTNDRNLDRNRVLVHCQLEEYCCNESCVAAKGLPSRGVFEYKFLGTHKHRE